MPKGEREKQAVKVKEVEELPPEPCYQRRVGFGSDMANKPGGEFGALLPPEEEGAILTISSPLLPSLQKSGAATRFSALGIRGTKGF